MTTSRIGWLMVCGLVTFQPTPITSQERLVREAILLDLEETEYKYLELAEAFGWEHYGWRPMPGVRSVGEVFMHVAAGNIQFPQLFEQIPIASVPDSLRRLPLFTDPAAPASERLVLEALRASFENARTAVRTLDDSSESAPVETSGDPVDVDAVLIRMSHHLHEHLGQLIAYARVNHIVPPWKR
ncbi:MAG: DinB family protein [Acidobacteriota bacterium]|nr:DinB family protein [Acidobacteriota bacterium]